MNKYDDVRSSRDMLAAIAKQCFEPKFSVRVNWIAHSDNEHVALGGGADLELFNEFWDQFLSFFGGDTEDELFIRFVDSTGESDFDYLEIDDMMECIYDEFIHRFPEAEKLYDELRDKVNEIIGTPEATNETPVTLNNRIRMVVTTYNDELTKILNAAEGDIVGDLIDAVYMFVAADHYDDYPEFYDDTEDDDD